MQHIRPLHLQCVIACLFLFFCSSRAALSNYSPFYMNATWTTGIPSSTTVVDSVFDNSSNVVYILDSQFKVYKLNYYTLSTSITRDWSSVVTSGMMPWSHERKTKNSVLGVNPYSSEVFLATYCYASSGRSTLIIYRFNGNLYQIGNSVQYTYSSSNFFTKQYRNPRLKLHFVSRDILHVAAFHDNSVYNGLWLSSIRISYNFGDDEEEDNNLTTKLATCLACLQITAVAIDFGCNGASVCIWTNSRAVSEYRLTDYSFKNQTTIDTLSTPIQFDPAAHRFGDVIFFVHRLVNDSSKLIAHSKTTTHNSVDTDVLPYRYDFPAQIDIDIRVSLGGSVFVGFTSNITSSNLNSYDIVISQYNSSLRRLSTTVMTTVRQDNLTLVIPRNNNMSFSVVGSSDGSLDNPNATQASRTIFVAHFKAFSISNVQPSIVSPGKSIEIEFSALPSGATAGIPRVIFNGRMCTNSRWNSNLLNTTVGPGVGGPHELSVIFDYLPFRPSVATDTMLSFPPAAILNIIPSEVPAAGYPITIILNPIGYTTESLAVEVGGRPCANAVQISENSLQCTVGPGTSSQVASCLLTCLLNLSIDRHRPKSFSCRNHWYQPQQWFCFHILPPPYLKPNRSISWPRSWQQSSELNV
ncbi:hypothetical protein BKA69DRAFT_711791 [Paraphysoderma sedebokerense]|nr:hypothetical protein BKA69DRAFT_152429 [Paraphysoderma sedebokerense]KAI9138955.1 hypothetical protein BKA69DRAFT_711791 [Paraphysoderma sedebokerense]